jgi:hypothetical protein
LLNAMQRYTQFLFLQMFYLKFSTFLQVFLIQFANLFVHNFL